MENSKLEKDKVRHLFWQPVELWLGSRLKAPKVVIGYGTISGVRQLRTNPGEAIVGWTEEVAFKKCLGGKILKDQWWAEYEALRET